MAMYGSELIDEVRAHVGREGSADAGVITDARVCRWINEGQRQIAEKVPGILALTYKCNTSVDATATLAYPLSDWTIPLYSPDATTTNIVNHIHALHILDGINSKEIEFVHTDVWDEIADPTSTDYGTDQPTYYTRRGGNLEIRPLASSGYYDQILRLDADFYPEDYTTTGTDATAHIPDADEGLIMYGTAKAYRAIGDTNSIKKAKELEFQFSNPDPRPGDKQGWLEDFKQQNDELQEWDGDLYGSL